MAYYENLKCGNCKYSFTDGYQSSNGFLKHHLGVPYVKCPNCEVVNKTGYAPYSTFHPVAKVYFWISIYVRNFIFCLLPSGLIVWALKDKTEAGLIFGLNLLVALGVSYYFGRKAIEEVEREYEDMT